MSAPAKTDGPAEDDGGRAKATAGESHAATGNSSALRLEEFLPYRLNVVASLTSHALSRIYSERYGISVPEWRVLVTLGQYGTMTGKAVGNHTHMHKTKVSRAVALLEKRKFVVRRVNRADLRETFLSLSASGRAIYEELAPIALEFARRLTQAIDPADHAAFDRSIERLTTSAAALAAEAGQNRDEDG
jgi:DNA-binding MarR family transcriptional regulator